MLKLPDPRLHIVYDRADDIKTATFLSKVANSVEGRVVVDVTPDGRNLDWLAVDIERGLGKNPHLSGAGRNTSDRWSRIHAWLIGGGVKAVFISRIQLLDERRLSAAITLAVTCGVDLWLVAQHHPLPESMATLLEDWPFEEVALAEFRRRWRGARQRRPATVEVSAPDTFPAVPQDEFVLFRAACRDLLSPEDFAVVDSAFQSTAALVTTWIDARNRIDEDTVVELVRDLVGRCDSLGEAVTRLRAMQVAFFQRRYLLKVNLDYLLAAHALQEQSELDAPTIAKLSSYAAARYPASAAIALGTGLAPAQIASLDLEDVGLRPDGVSIGPGQIPCEASALILPHVVERILDGAGGSDPLFVMHTTDKSKRDNRTTDRAVERLLVQILREVGVRITGARSYTGLRGRGDNWRWREGISIQTLKTPAEAA